MKEFSKQHSLMVKGIAIMLLLLYHLFHEQSILEEMQVNFAPFSRDGFLMFSGFGNICVAIFVMLTAYGIGTSVFSNSGQTIGEIYTSGLKRFGKLILGFTAVYVTVNLLCFSHFDYANLYGDGKQGIIMMLCDATGLSAVLKTPMLNPTWWYMKIAYVLIFLVPLLALVVKKLGNVTLLLAFFAPYVISFDPDIERYFFVAVFGVVAAYGKWPQKVMNMKIHPFFWWIGAAFGMFLVVLIRQNALIKDWFWNYVDAFVAFFIICATVMTVGRVPVVNTVLKFIGKHSMNIFLVHTFFYMLVWRKYVYHFQYAAVTFLILLGISLLYSVLLEFIKKGIGKIIKIFKKKAKKD